MVQMSWEQSTLKQRNKPDTVTKERDSNSLAANFNKHPRMIKQKNVEVIKMQYCFAKKVLVNRSLTMLFVSP